MEGLSCARRSRDLGAAGPWWLRAGPGVARWPALSEPDVSYTQPPAAFHMSLRPQFVAASNPPLPQQADSGNKCTTLGLPTCIQQLQMHCTCHAAMQRMKRSEKETGRAQYQHAAHARMQQLTLLSTPRPCTIPTYGQTQLNARCQLCRCRPAAHKAADAKPAKSGAGKTRAAAAVAAGRSHRGRLDALGGPRGTPGLT